MNIFKSISDFFSNLVSSKKEDTAKKSDILGLIDNNLSYLKLVSETIVSNQDILNYIQTNLFKAVGSHALEENVEMKARYDAYVKALSPNGRRLEDKSMFGTIYQTAIIALDDHQKLRDNFESLFNQGTNPTDIEIEQLKLSHAAIFGYINLSNLMCDWFCFVFGGIVGNTDETLRIPAYRDVIIKQSISTVGDFVNSVLARGKSKSILDVVANIKEKGDVVLYTNSASLDTYANIRNYPEAVSLFGGFQPIMWIHDYLAMRSYNQYKRNQAMRDWMQAKVALLRMDMSKVDPTSQEYQKLLAILNKYSDFIAEYDKKIAKYENS